LIRCEQSSEAVNKTFVVSDGQDLSTPELVRALARALRRPARLLNVPESTLRFAAKMTGNMAGFTRLCASLTLDMQETMRTLEWRPPLSIEESLARTVAWYRQVQSEH
jgi:nucleoside-diphosphate-sugar epimerase